MRRVTYGAERVSVCERRCSEGRTGVKIKSKWKVPGRVDGGGLPSEGSPGPVSFHVLERERDGLKDQTEGRGPMTTDGTVRKEPQTSRDQESRIP